MADKSTISWCDSTHNEWEGCTHASEGCKWCYAEGQADRRLHRTKWGPGGERRQNSPTERVKPDVWQLKAVKGGRQRIVFSASMSDVFEDNPQVVEWRRELFARIDRCTLMDWILLTKRGQNIRRMAPAGWLENWPEHVWPAVSVCDGASTNQLDNLIDVPAKTRCVSIEPLLEEVDFGPWLRLRNPDGTSAITCVFVGGEFGADSTRIRPMHPDWVRNIRDVCYENGVLFHFKQHGSWLHESQFRYLGISPLKVKNRRFRQWPDGSRSYWCSTGDAGELFDGAWHHFTPNPRQVRRPEGGTRPVPAHAGQVTETHHA